MTRVVAGEQARAVLALAEPRHIASRIVCRRSRRSRILEPVADLDPDLAILDRHDDQQAVVLAALADAAAAVLEHLDGVFADVGVWLERGHRRDDDDVAAGRLQGLDAAIELARLVGSMTLAKSLTAPVSAGGGGCAAAPDWCAPRRRGDDAIDARCASCAMPSIDVAPDPFAGVDVAREQRARIGDRYPCRCCLPRAPRG